MALDDRDRRDETCRFPPPSRKRGSRVWGSEALAGLGSSLAAPRRRRLVLRSGRSVSLPWPPASAGETEAAGPAPLPAEMWTARDVVQPCYGASPTASRIVDPAFARASASASEGVTTPHVGATPPPRRKPGSRVSGPLRHREEYAERRAWRRWRERSPAPVRLTPPTGRHGAFANERKPVTGPWTPAFAGEADATGPSRTFATPVVAATEFGLPSLFTPVVVAAGACCGVEPFRQVGT